MDVHWNQGAEDCSRQPQPPLQVHAYNPRTFVLREGLCSTFEAPFLYLLIGSGKALLIDTGDVADPQQMPLAKTVMDLLPQGGAEKLPLLVVHTHRHLDHRAGDPQFAHLPNVEVVGYELESVRRYYHFTDWPGGVAQLDLGDRVVDVMPTPGHNQTEVSFYDRNTGLFFSGDFLMPGRLLIDDAAVGLASSEKVAGFARNHPIALVLGGHIEMNAAGDLYPWQSTYHPKEHVLQMSNADLLALPVALRRFNGIYTVSGQYTMENSIRILVASGVLILVLLVGVIWLLIRYFRRR
jgi:glyoxylase-like metal-dependent hydrolase (beta-lactamase superfamily II)